jgi:hypothetical protein
MVASLPKNFGFDHVDIRMRPFVASQETQPSRSGKVTTKALGMCQVPILYTKDNGDFIRSTARKEG